MPDEKKPNYRLHRPEREQVDQKSPSYSKFRKLSKSQDQFYNEKRLKEEQLKRSSKDNTPPRDNNYYEKSKDYPNDKWFKSKKSEPEIYEGRKIYRKSRIDKNYSKDTPESRKYVKPEIREYGKSRKPGGNDERCGLYLPDACPNFCLGVAWWPEDCALYSCQDHGGCSPVTCPPYDTSTCPDHCTPVCVSY